LDFYRCRGFDGIVAIQHWAVPRSRTVQRLSMDSYEHMKLVLAIALLLVTSLSADSMGLINIKIVNSNFLCDNGSGGCLGGTAGYVLDNVSGRLLAR